MELYVGIVVGLAGVVCILAGVKGRGTNLFTAVTGTAATTSSTAGGFGGGGDFGGSFGSPAAPSPLRPGSPAASVGPGSGSGAVMFA